MIDFFINCRLLLINYTFSKQVEDTKLIKATDDKSTELEVEILVSPTAEQHVRPVGFDIPMGAKLVDKGKPLPETSSMT